MDTATVLRSIHSDHVLYIQQKVLVDYDNSRQQPVSFIHEGQEHSVQAIVARFRLTDEHMQQSYLLEDSEHSVYFLYFQTIGSHDNDCLKPGFWVLGYRILDDRELMSWYREERSMLANVSLKRVIDFHGHICPELAIGGKFCEFVQKQVKSGSIPETGLSVVSENTTSALDAIQVLLGITIGNQRLLVLDYGKHTYSLLCRDRDLGWKLRMKPQVYGDEDRYAAIEGKILDDQATLDDLLDFQRLLDTRIEHILGLTPEELFYIENIESAACPREISGAYCTCSLCCELVLTSRSVENGGSLYCLPCFKKTHPGCQMHGMH
jgi:formylmethanofuran dehydrogenase subunit E